MEIINILENDNYLDEYIILCNDEWGNSLVDVESKKIHFIESNIST